MAASPANSPVPSLVRWGMIGCGSVTEVKSGPAYQQTDGFELAAVMCRDLSKARAYARRHNVPKFYDDADELIGNDEIDAVYIATPPDSHLHYALKVAAAGKICCVEKPMATSYQESVTMRDAFAERELPLFVAYYRRSLPRFEHVKTWLENREIGEVRHVSWHLSKPANDSDLSGKHNWRTDLSTAFGGYFDDLASHGLDLLTYFLGDIEQVVGICVNQQNLYTAKDAVVASWLHQNDVTGSGSWNFGSSEREDKVTIYGSKGHLSFSVFDDVPLFLSNEQGEQKIHIENPTAVQLHHVRNIQKHLAGEIRHPSTGATGAHTSWVMDRILGRFEQNISLVASSECHGGLKQVEKRPLESPGQP